MVILLIVLVVCIGLIIYMIKQAFENNVLHHDVQLMGEKEQVSLFFISDVHVRKINEQMIKNINKPIDAVIIGGDFADKRTPIERIYQNISILQSLGPVYFVWGNNDREVGEERLRTIFNETNVTIIENESFLMPNMKNPFRLVAIDDTSSKNARVDLAFKGCKEHDLILFISHDPQIFNKVLQRFHPMIMLGGHLHGGQIRIGPYSMHPHGSFKVRNGKYELISNGYGTTLLPMRLGAKPQCHIIDVNFMK
ncbi:serine/threonine protein phosphatase [Lysinibacillus antri]|uniref:Serine/threonine protein phosphatase n=1 Tax=Lysinibacillus antri TaxID=2498145 RepID=A0A3S0RX18_9BACI|nr:serine/threonine protein phosphatase [Lysinibacillus antri]TSI10156.1 serine/threonine protein phosphatase [Lysinibacillus sp. BW-2-10]